MINARDNRHYPPNSIRTYSGTIFEVLNIDIKQIHIRDIAHSLSLQCRFTGHTSTHLSIAQHSIWVSQHLPEELKLAGLLHDASEAYLVDIPSPLKPLLPQYLDIEENLMWAIYQKYGIPWHHLDLIKKADQEALQYEWDAYIVHCIDKPTEQSHKYWEEAFLNEFFKIAPLEMKEEQ